jgi:hypothetical protein
LDRPVRPENGKGTALSFTEESKASSAALVKDEPAAGICGAIILSCRPRDSAKIFGSHDQQTDFSCDLLS